jgi:hypothetical protein
VWLCTSTGTGSVLVSPPKRTAGRTCSITITFSGS